MTIRIFMIQPSGANLGAESELRHLHQAILPRALAVCPARLDDDDDLATIAIHAARRDGHAVVALSAAPDWPERRAVEQLEKLEQQIPDLELVPVILGAADNAYVDGLDATAAAAFPNHGPGWDSQESGHTTVGEILSALDRIVPEPERTALRAEVYSVLALRGGVRLNLPGLRFRMHVGGPSRSMDRAGQETILFAGKEFLAFKQDGRISVYGAHDVTWRRLAWFAAPAPEHQERTWRHVLWQIAIDDLRQEES